jgi:hypothetical protein
LTLEAFILCLASGDPSRAGVFLDTDGDGVTDGADLCPGTVIPESIPERDLAYHHFVLLDADDVFDTRTPDEGLISSDYTTATTAGCSCEQIIVILEVGEGHEKYGCSPSVMQEFIADFASDLIFKDSFESGDTLVWSNTQP